MKVINLFKNYFQKMPFSATSINKILSGSRKEILVSLEILLLPYLGSTFACGKPQVKSLKELGAQ